MPEEKKGSLKLFEREFAVPGLSMVLAAANGLAELGMEKWEIFGILAAALVYSGIRAWQKVQEAKLAKG